MLAQLSTTVARSSDPLRRLGRRAATAAQRSVWFRHTEGSLTALALRALLAAVDTRLRLDKSFRRLIYRTAQDEPDGAVLDDWRAILGLQARDGSFALRARFGNGRVKCRRASGWGDEEPADATLSFRDAAAARALLTKSPGRVLDMLLTGELVFTGNLSHVARLSFLLSSFKGGGRHPELAARRSWRPPPPRHSLPMHSTGEVRHLDDPGLSRYALGDFPRLGRLLEDYFTVMPEMCAERPLLYTRFFREHGLDPTRCPAGEHPALRQARAFRYLMERRQPIVRAGDLLGGTTTSKTVGVVIYPECGGIPIWPELGTVSHRQLNPYRITAEARRVLSEEVFPFWMDRNVREHARATNAQPRSLALDERFVLYFQWKTQAVSHTIPDFPRVLDRGMRALCTEALRRADGADDRRTATLYQAMAEALEGVMHYAAELARHARQLAAAEPDPTRRAELEAIAQHCAKVPAEPAETLHEALQAVWLTWIGCHMENTNAGLSIGRLDHLLQPFFEADMAKLERRGASTAERQAYVERVIELVGCFYLRCTDHLPQVADLGNKLFGGSASGQVITLGGVNADGSNAVGDMTYICLKVTEMLGLKDPNINARYHEGINSVDYLRRLCEVNLLTGATPSMHNDQAIIEVLRDQGMTMEHARDWSATGCVEPTSCGRHYGHTNCMMFNLVAPLEMALRRGYHPLVGEQVGPDTGDPASFASFEQVLRAYFTQLESLIQLATEANNMLGRSHQLIRPTPLLSALIDGPLERGLDLSEGGARYNSSGSGNVGLVDVVDSLRAIEQLVFDEQRVDMATLVAALDDDFAGHDKLLARAENRVPKLGSGATEPLRIAKRVVAFCHDTFRAQPHYRGGHYNSGFWSMSNHVAFGTLSGALPSGRRRGKAFTPGLTPAPSRDASLVDQMHDVAALDHHQMPNNVAFNIKVVPGPHGDQAQTVDQLSGYTRAYFQQGGMQMQLNLVSSATLREAMAHPERYPTLMVRISGYNAYFNDLNDDMKRELIERAEHRLGQA